MMPYSKINIGDGFSNPLLRGRGNCSDLEWYVTDKKEGMIQVQAFSNRLMKPYGDSIWKKNTDRMFSESWRVFKSGNL